MAKKVIVIGGGLSGLTVAEELLRKEPKLEVTVLEAMDRVGGRSWSVQLHGAMFDLGGMWVGPHQKHILELAKRAKQDLIKQEFTGLKILEFGKQVGTYASDIPNNVNLIGLIQMQYLVWKINRMARTVPLRNPGSCKNAIYWDSITVYSWIHQNVWFEKVKKLVEAAVRAVFGVEPSQISMLFFLWYTHQSGSFDNLINIRKGNQQSKLIFGSQYLSLFLKKEIEKMKGQVILNQPVAEVDQTGDHIQVTTRSGKKFVGDYVVIAMPPVRVNKIIFKPKLCERRETLNQKHFMGSIIKILVLYEKNFWKEKGFSGQTLSDCIDSPVFNAYDDSRPKQNGELQSALVVFVNGAIARYWGQKESLKSRTLEKLAQYFGPSALNPLDVHIQNWCEEQHIRGGPIGNFPPGALSMIGDFEVNQPDGKVHWAGTEMAHESQGFLDGAVQSGKRAADQVLRKMQGEVELHQAERNETPGYYNIITSYKRWFNYFM